MKEKGVITRILTGINSHQNKEYYLMDTKLILNVELTEFEKSAIVKLIQKALLAQQIESELLHERKLRPTIRL